MSSGELVLPNKLRDKNLAFRDQEKFSKLLKIIQRISLIDF